MIGGKAICAPFISYKVHLVSCTINERRKLAMHSAPAMFIITLGSCSSRCKDNSAMGGLVFGLPVIDKGM